MTVPQSNFRVATPSGWFVFHDGTMNRTARMNGKTLYSVAQSALRNSSELAGGGARTYDGSIIHGTDVGIDGDWGTASDKALWAVLNARSAGSAVLTAVSTAARARVMNRAVLTMIADVALRSLGYSLPYEPHIPPDALMPPYGTSMPGTASPLFAVSAATQDEVDASQGSVAPPRTPTGPVAPRPTPTPTPTPTPDGTSGDGKDTMGGNGSASDKSGSGAGAGSGGGSLPTGGTGTVAAPASGISWGPIVATVAAVVVFGAIAYSLSQPSRSAQVSQIRHAARARTRAMRTRHASV